MNKFALGHFAWVLIHYCREDSAHYQNPFVDVDAGRKEGEEVGSTNHLLISYAGHQTGGQEIIGQKQKGTDDDRCRKSRLGPVSGDRGWSLFSIFWDIKTRHYIIQILLCINKEAYSSFHINRKYYTKLYTRNQESRTKKRAIFVSVSREAIPNEAFIFIFFFFLSVRLLVCLSFGWSAH